jgi:molybdopterin-biosynthesis enzyme MoeA-like protein
VAVIGDEVLSGKIHESNSHFAACRFRALGVRLAAILVMPDDPLTISAWIDHIKGRYDVVVTTGGVGPTHDDRTLEALALALFRPLVLEPSLVTALESIYGPELTQAHLKMARIPEGAELIFGPGLVYPVVKLDEIHVLPGHPTFFTRAFLAIEERFRAAPYHVAKLFLRCPEPSIAPLLARVEQRFHVTVGSYPDYGNPEYHLQVTIESKDADRVRRGLSWLQARIPASDVVRIEPAGPYPLQAPNPR